MKAFLAIAILTAASLAGQSGYAQIQLRYQSALEDMIHICVNASDQQRAEQTFVSLGYLRPGPRDFATVRNMETDNETMRRYAGPRAVAALDAWRLDHLTGADMARPAQFWADYDRKALIAVRTTPFGDLACDYYGAFSLSDAYFVAMISMAGSVREISTGNLTRLKNTLGGAPFRMTMYSMDETLAPALSQPAVLAPSSITIERG
ncbi:hypothetical protein [Shimia ponticola]|uniref:hypothetical protein n=1 Tax=Shimia ponticola TaxID=2582893 RepID=UPI0011BDB9E9|nr:hypothetical protein [Shimia ponticola]